MVYLDSFLKRQIETSRISKVKKRDIDIDSIMDVLQDWRTSPFENEGSVRAAVRAAFCAKGLRWPLADRNSADIVEAGLRRMGATRPSWDEGQRSHADRGAFCARCGAELEGGAGRYCSASCARITLAMRAEETHFSQSSAGTAAYKAILRESLPPKICFECGTSYKPRSVWKVTQKFCGPGCYHTSLRKNVARPCVTCGLVFTPRRADNLYCSAQCHKAKLFNERVFSKICGWCGVSYTAKAPNASFCTISCRNKAQYKRRTGAVPTKEKVIEFPQTLTVLVFDGWFQRAA